jgi:hypothetical protein
MSPGKVETCGVLEQLISKARLLLKQDLHTRLFSKNLSDLQDFYTVFLNTDRVRKYL